MVRSRMPVLSLLGLFGALLMLSPELLMGSPTAPAVEIPHDFDHVPLTDAELQKAIIYSVELYNNWLRLGYPNYFRLESVLMAKSKIQADGRYQYLFMLNLVETACTKTAGEIMNYEGIERCNPIPGNPEKRICFFRTRPGTPPNEIKVTHFRCD